MSGWGSGSARFDQALHHGGQVARDGVSQSQHLDACGVGHIERRDDAAQALQVVAVVGDHQRIGAGVDVDGVVGADQGAQHRHQVVHVFVVELEDLRDDLPSPGRHGPGRHGAALQLGFGLGHHGVEPGRLHQRKALGAQLRSKQPQGLCRGHGYGAGQRHRALDTRVNHHVGTRQGGQGAGHGLDLGVHKIERDGFAARGFEGWRIRHRVCRGFVCALGMHLWCQPAHCRQTGHGQSAARPAGTVQGAHVSKVVHGVQVLKQGVQQGLKVGEK